MSEATWHRGAYIVREDGTDGLEVVVDGLIDPTGLFAIQRPMIGHLDRWGVTHLPSGLALGEAVPTLVDAYRWYRIVAGMPINWRHLSVDEAASAKEIGRPLWQAFADVAWADRAYLRRSLHFTPHRTHYVPRRPRRLRRAPTAPARRPDGGAPG